MLKIRDTLIKKIYSNNLTKYELIALIELIKISDEEGIAQIYYKEMVNAIGCNIATFYNVLNSLKEKNFIEFEKNQQYKREIVVGICGNNFKDNYKDFVNINNIFTCGDMIYNLGAGEIRLLLYFMFRISKQKYSNDIKSIFHDKNRLYYKASYKCVSERLNITIRMTKIYMKNLLMRKIISIAEQQDVNGKRYDIITIAKKIMEAPKEIITQKGKEVEMNITSMQLHYKNSVKNICRRNNIMITNKTDLNDTAILMSQYIKSAVKMGKNIYKIIDTAVKNLRSDILESKVLHYIIKSLINKDYNENIIMY